MSGRDRSGQRRSAVIEAWFSRGRVLRYLIVATIKVAVDFAVFNIVIFSLAEPRWSHLLVANGAGFFAAGWIAFRLNAKYAFRAKRRPGDFRRFLLVSFGGGVLYNLALLAIAEGFGANGHTELNLAKLAALQLSAIWNFLGYSAFVFDRPNAGSDTSEGPSRKAA